MKLPPCALCNSTGIRVIRVSEPEQATQQVLDTEPSGPPRAFRAAFTHGPLLRFELCECIIREVLLGTPDPA